MKINTVWAAYFSATDTTKKVVTRIAQRLADQAGVELKTFDFTPAPVRQEAKSFGEGDLVVFGTPVYAGRVPNLLIKFVSSVQGNGAYAVPVVCYGNRSFDDGLMELCLTLEGNGFTTLGAAAFSCQHSFSQTQNAGRPDISDLTIAGGFADQVWMKGGSDGPISAKVKGNNPVGPYYTPRDREGNPLNILKVKVSTDPDLCTHCGICAKECPLGSIDLEDETIVSGPCMKCNRCVKYCPEQAKFFDAPNFIIHKEDLEERFSWPRKTPDLYI